MGRCPQSSSHAVCVATLVSESVTAFLLRRYEQPCTLKSTVAVALVVVVEVAAAAAAATRPSGVSHTRN